MQVGAMQSVTVGVSDLAASLRLYRDVMGLVVESDVAVARDRLDAWGLHGTTTARLVELSCGGYPVGRLRLLATDPRAREPVRLDPAVGGSDSPQDVGPKAIDFYVNSPIDDYVDELLAAGCVARSKPVRHVIGDTESEELVLFGPDGVPLLLMVGHRHPPTSLRPGSPHGRYSEVPTVSVVGADPDATRRFYAGVLGLTATVDGESPEEHRDAVCRLVGVPPGTRIQWLLYQRPEEPSGKLLVVHFGGLDARRLAGRMRPGRLGVVLYTHLADDLDAVAQQAQAAGFPLALPPTPLDSIGTRVLLLRGPNEELFEVVERS